MPGLTIITTSDGSHSLMDTDLNETYHSVHGAIRESRHVFLSAGLSHWLSLHDGRPVRILEIGFGTGLNAFLTALESHASGIPVVYTSWEVFPLAHEIVTQLNYPSELGALALFATLHEAAWNKSVDVSPTFRLIKRRGDVLKSAFDPTAADLIYYDAFAPGKQPELWTNQILEKVCGVLAPGGLFVTYCARGQVKRDLRSIGLVVETLPGPPGKREMIRASRQESKV